MNGNIFTILISCYNAEEFLKRCLDSLVNQDNLDFFEILFVNDNSTDNSLNIAESYSKNLNNFRLINNQKNMGLVQSCNRALKEIRTPYFIRLDADDWLSADAMEKILKELNTSDKADFIIFKRFNVWRDKVEPVNLNDNDIYSWISAGNIFNTEAVKTVGGYSDEYWEEYDLYIKLLEAGYRYRLSPYHIYYYRKGHQSMTNSYPAKKEGFDSLLKKWGRQILGRYGDYSKIIEYYA